MTTETKTDDGVSEAMLDALAVEVYGMSHRELSSFAPHAAQQHVRALAVAFVVAIVEKQQAERERNEAWDAANMAADTQNALENTLEENDRLRRQVAALATDEHIALLELYIGGGRSKSATEARGLAQLMREAKP